MRWYVCLGNQSVRRDVDAGHVSGVPKAQKAIEVAGAPRVTPVVAGRLAHVALKVFRVRGGSRAPKAPKAELALKARWKIAPDALP